MPSAARTASESALKVYERKIAAVYQLLCTPTVLSPGTKSMWAAGHRAGVVFFARHLDSFIVTQNFAAIYRDWCHLDNFIVTLNSQPSTGTGKKHVTATQTAPNQTAGPLALIRGFRHMNLIILPCYNQFVASAGTNPILFDVYDLNHHTYYEK